MYTMFMLNEIFSIFLVNIPAAGRCLCRTSPDLLRALRTDEGGIFCKMTTTREHKRDNQLFWETQESSIYCCYKEEPIDSQIRFLHCHDGYEVLIMKSGDIAMQIEDRLISLRSGDVLLIPPYIFHFARQQSSDTYCRIVLNIKESAIQKLISRNEGYRHITDVFYQAKDYRIHIGDPALSQLLLLSQALQEATEDSSDSFGNEILMVSLLSIILVLLNRQSGTSSEILPISSASSQSMPEVVKDIFHYVDQNLNGRLSVAEIADRAHLNSVYLTRMFRQYTGLSLQQYIIEKRLAEAKRLLRNGQSPMDVCFACGFNNYSNFSRTFTNHVKISPRQYQENSRASFTPYSG